MYVLQMEHTETNLYRKGTMKIIANWNSVNMCYQHSIYLLSLLGENILWPETGNISLCQKVWTWSKDNGGISEEHRRLEKCECGGGFVPIRV